MRIVVLGVVVAAASLGLLSDHIDELVFLHRHVFFDESHDGFAQANFIVETGWAHDRRRLRSTLGHLDRALLFVHGRVELADLNAVDALLARVLQDDQLVSDDALRDLLLFGCVELVRFRHLVHQILATVLLLGGHVED